MLTTIFKEEDGTIAALTVTAETPKERDELAGLADSFSSRKEPEPEKVLEQG
jgi:hypothetical protein